MKQIIQVAEGDSHAIQTVKLMQSSLGGCIGCGALTSNVGMFIPNDPKKFGAPKGMKAIIYRLCDDCHDSISHESVEANLLQELRVN